MLLLLLLFALSVMFRIFELTWLKVHKNNNYCLSKCSVETEDTVSFGSHETFLTFLPILLSSPIMGIYDCTLCRFDVIIAKSFARFMVSELNFQPFYITYMFVHEHVFKRYYINWLFTTYTLIITMVFHPCLMSA